MHSISTLHIQNPHSHMQRVSSKLQSVQWRTNEGTIFPRTIPSNKQNRIPNMQILPNSKIVNKFKGGFSPIFHDETNYFPPPRKWPKEPSGAPLRFCIIATLTFPHQHQTQTKWRATTCILYIISFKLQICRLQFQFATHNFVSQLVTECSFTQRSILEFWCMIYLKCKFGFLLQSSPNVCLGEQEPALFCFCIIHVFDL